MRRSHHGRSKILEPESSLSFCRRALRHVYQPRAVLPSAVTFRPMTLRRPTAAFIIAIVSLLPACGGGDDGLKAAAQACTGALTKQSGQSDDAMVARDKTIADMAAKAAVTSDKWKDVAKATSDWALTRQETVAATKTLQSGGNITPELQQLPGRIADARRELIAACRGVKASGGNVNESLLNSI